MNQIITTLVVLALTLESTAALAAEKPTEAPGKMIERPAIRATRTSAAKVPESSLAKAIVWEGVAIEEPDFTIWGASPILADGKVHLFAARWPEANVDPAWRKSSEIAHYVADKPEGPFRFRSVVVTRRAKA